MKMKICKKCKLPSPKSEAACEFCSLIGERPSVSLKLTIIAYAAAIGLVSLIAILVML